jgi:hypothetical protein
MLKGIHCLARAIDRRLAIEVSRYVYTVTTLIGDEFALDTEISH